MKRCSDFFKVIPVAEPKRLSSDRHKYEPVWDFLHVKTNYFKTGLWLDKAHASHVLTRITCAHHVV